MCNETRIQIWTETPLIGNGVLSKMSSIPPANLTEESMERCDSLILDQINHFETTKNFFYGMNNVYILLSTPAFPQIAN
jgi:hypothetical protein